MDEGGPLFVLAGNGSYDNRGCEAIARGTTKILREHFKDPKFICLSHFQSEEQYREQCLWETDRAIVHLTSHRISKRKMIQNFWKPKTWCRAYQYFSNRDASYAQAYTDMLPYLEETAAVLSVGGDNYSLDYGVPTLFTALDDLVLERGRPIILWGASVGPFSAKPDYESYMSDHLQKVTGIFARESTTVEYLESIGVSENVHIVADPAFLMDPMKPEEDMPIEEDAIGLNLSPLMAEYVTDGNLEEWTAMAAAIIAEIARRTERKVYLIPHVTNPSSNDHTFMQSALSLIPEKNENITLIQPHYNAAETKWFISQMALFAGARTHSTIAAISSGVPTLSFAYSIKARGINRDILGHESYCLAPDRLQPEAVAGKIADMLESSDQIKIELRKKIPVMPERARDAGRSLCDLLRD